VSCPGCAGTRAIPDDLTGGYLACPTCVIETSFVVLDDPNLAAEDR